MKLITGYNLSFTCFILALHSWFVGIVAAGGLSKDEEIGLIVGCVLGGLLLICHVCCCCSRYSGVKDEKFLMCCNQN
ncbi:hypothetical protein Btru_058694 [Bulinus truncatus]|nr:hypothetical protein Btru_058694 [Bulinus truncatus]